MKLGSPGLRPVMTKEREVCLTLAAMHIVSDDAEAAWAFQPFGMAQGAADVVEAGLPMLVHGDG